MKITVLDRAKMAEVLFVTPHGWGLRGDPYLWDALREQFVQSEVWTLEAFWALLWSVFEKYAGGPPEAGKLFFVEDFAFGGMSSGMLSSDFWLEQAFPLLKERFMACL